MNTTNYTGRSALDLARDNTPADLRAEAYWLVWADGRRGTDIVYDGERDGIHWWLLGGSQAYLKSKPKPMSEEDHERLEASLRVYYARERERMLKVGELR